MPLAVLSFHTLPSLGKFHEWRRNLGRKSPTGVEYIALDWAEAQKLAAF